MSRIRVWDLPTRLFHWTIVLLMPALWWTAEEDMHELHLLLGEVALGLILFRLFWGFLGSSTARFSSFARGPVGVLRYLRGAGGHGPGHNPLGGWSVMAMLALLSAVTVLGLVAGDEDGLVSGPLSRLVSYDAAREAADLHEDLFNLLLVLIGLHVAAILFYLVVRRDNLVAPMVSGAREDRGGEQAMVAAPGWRFLVAAGAATALAWWIAHGL